MHQIHDFNPGIAESGLFWTIRLPADSVHVDLEDATASLDVTDLDIEDYHDLVNALQDGPSVPAMVSYHIRWRGVKQRVKIRDTANNFAGRFIEDTATIAWSAREQGFKFVSDPARTSTNEFSVIGHERNGIFFPQTDAELDSAADLQADLAADTSE